MEMCLKLFTSVFRRVEYGDVAACYCCSHSCFRTRIRLWLRGTISLKLKDGSSILPVSLSCERKVQSVSVITGWLTTNRQHWSAASVLPPFYRCVSFKMSSGIFKTEKKEHFEISQSLFFKGNVLYTVHKERNLILPSMKQINNVDMSCRKDIFQSWLDSCETTCHVSEMANLWLHSHAHKKKPLYEFTFEINSMGFDSLLFKHHADIVQPCESLCS